jgi:hypothetical protein
VAAALGSPLFGVAPFWIRHCGIPFNRAACLAMAQATKQNLVVQV